MNQSAEATPFQKLLFFFIKVKSNQFKYIYIVPNHKRSLACGVFPYITGLDRILRDIISESQQFPPRAGIKHTHECTYFAPLSLKYQQI